MRARWAPPPALAAVQALLAELLFAKPPEPRQHMVAALERIKVAGSRPLLDTQDLATVFGMLDATKRGAVTQQQAADTLLSVLGSSRALQAPPPPAAATLDQQQFVSYMSSALQAATPMPT